MSVVDNPQLKPWFQTSLGSSRKGLFIALRLSVFSCTHVNAHSAAALALLGVRLFLHTAVTASFIVDHSRVGFIRRNLYMYMHFLSLVTFPTEGRRRDNAAFDAKCVTHLCYIYIYMKCYNGVTSNLTWEYGASNMLSHLCRCATNSLVLAGAARQSIWYQGMSIHPTVFFHLFALLITLLTLVVARRQLSYNFDMIDRMCGSSDVALVLYLIIRKLCVPLTT